MDNQTHVSTSPLAHFELSRKQALSEGEHGEGLLARILGVNVYEIKGKKAKNIGRNWAVWVLNIDPC